MTDRLAEIRSNCHGTYPQWDDHDWLIATVEEQRTTNNDLFAEVERMKEAAVCNKIVFDMRPINTAAQAKAIDASITVAFYNGMERAAVIADEYDKRYEFGTGEDIAAAIRKEIK